MTRGLNKVYCTAARGPSVTELVVPTPAQVRSMIVLKHNVARKGSGKDNKVYIATGIGEVYLRSSSKSPNVR